MPRVRAFYFRLLDLLRDYFPYRENELKIAIDSYIAGSNDSIHLLFHEIKDKIIEDFNLYQPSFIKRIKQKVNDLGFVTSKDFPELINQENWTLIRESSPNIKIWLIYDKGKTVAYVWNSQKLSDNEARKKAELQLLLI
ncbi:putative transcriptional regulator [Streptococcus pyogenes]|nr:putative transcriptional regulator [Streptococcus pyogenes]